MGGERTYHLRRRYGITAEDFNQMSAEQGGLCAICVAAPAAHVDHDHETGRVRQLLCFNCNGGLGQFRDDHVVLRSAAAYVEEHRELASVQHAGDGDQGTGELIDLVTARESRVGQVSTAELLLQGALIAMRSIRGDDRTGTAPHPS